MKTKIIILTFILSLGKYAKAQNLVPNNSFEQITSCPAAASSTYNYIVNWVDPTNATADLLDTCMHESYINLPLLLLQTYIYRYPRTGGAMSGIFLMNKGSSCATPSQATYREYIEVQLNNILQANQLYYVEFYAVPAQSMVYGVHNIGAALTQNELLGSGSSHVFSIIPQIEPPSNLCLTDTGYHWSRICGYVIGTGVEQYLTIGNFYQDSSTIKSVINPNGYCGAYYFIDDVSVIEVNHLDSWNAGPDKYINLGDSVQIGNPNTDYSIFKWVTGTNGVTYLSDSTDAHPWSKPSQTTTYYVTKTQGTNIFQDTVTVYITNSTGINQFVRTIDINVYPNPAKNKIHIEAQSIEEITLFDLLGNESKNTKENVIDVSNLSEGVYFIQVKTKYDVSTRKIIVQH